ncbi:MAG: hypothetical protein HYT62_01700 [Candidatus Yanofskybacteria bacterium]|nr:hypothetical protein [Candidatus Yanofskybacteria bacterium]
MSSRTLTKERVKTSVSLGDLDINSGTSSLELIDDGPNEAVCRLVSKFQQANQQANHREALERQARGLAINEMASKQNLASMFIDAYTYAFNITINQMGVLVQEIGENNLPFLENKLFERLRKRAGVIVSASIISGGAFTVDLIDIFSSGSLVLLPLPLFMVCFLGWILPFLVLVSSGTARSEPFRSVSYIRARKRLKKKYGPDYFPYQELRKELRLAESVSGE